MAYSEALKDIGYDANTAFRSSYVKSESETPKEPINFNKVFREKYAAGFGEFNEDTGFAAESPTSFSAGAAAEMLGVMSQMKDPYGLDGFDFLDGQDELDDSIGFDEIEQLDVMAEDEAAQTAGEELSEISDDDLTTFIGIEDII